jgi:TPR repeat protein
MFGVCLVFPRNIFGLGVAGLLRRPMMKRCGARGADVGKPMHSDGVLSRARAGRVVAALAAWLMVAVLAGSTIAGPRDDATAALSGPRDDATAALAGPIGEAAAAYRRGDYAIAKRIAQRLVADEGNRPARFLLVILRYSGQVTQPIFAWLRKAADEGHADVQLVLGDWYYTGHEVQQSYPNALRWYRKAAEQGEPWAQFYCGLMYHHQPGVDYAEALKWWRKAAVQGHVFAQQDLGTMYEGGQGVPQNYVLAYMWYTLASSSLHKPAIELRKNLAAKMTSAQIAEGQRMSERCLRSNYADCDDSTAKKTPADIHAEVTRHRRP